MRYWGPSDYVAAGFFLLIAFLLLFLAYVIYTKLTSETFELRKDSWQCTDSAVRTRVIMAGKTSVVQTYTECKQWTRK